MDEKIQFEIITPTSTQLLSIQWIEIESPTGSFLVGPGHCPLISIIRNQSIVTYKQELEQSVTMRVSLGIFKVDNNKVTIILDQ